MAAASEHSLAICGDQARSRRQILRRAGGETDVAPDTPASVPTSHLRRFFLPRVTPLYILRVVAVAALAYGFFGHICVPARINGRSMEPTYRSGGFMFCWRPRYWLQPLRRGDIVMVRLAGPKIMYLKRVVALAGDTLAFHDGQLLINGEAVPEPYLAGPCDWNLPQRTVAQGRVYVVGDNRTMSMREHLAGSVSADRIEGGPLW